MQFAERFIACLVLMLFVSACSPESSKDSIKRTVKKSAEMGKVQLAEWGRGVSLTAPDDPEMTVYLWFYEWKVLHSIDSERQSRGPQYVQTIISEDGTSARLRAVGVSLKVKTDSDGATLTLEVTNRSLEIWPETAGIVPCLNPGDPPQVEVKRNSRMVDAEQSLTWFMGSGGEEKLIGRDLHFLENKLEAVKSAAPQGWTNLFPKWPISPINAREGVLIRESEDGEWIAGIGWEDVLFVQGHNEWKCMHVCVRVGPLAPGESKTIRGRIWLRRGGREEAFREFKETLNP